MNVLVLTPDRVGSTLLQRLLTVYMLRQGFDRPVINLHELSNGLVRYYNDFLQQEVLGKPKGTDWGYFQSLPEVVELLDSVDHYKTSRLAHYHLLRRKDSLDDQIKFYEYLNKNFFIISCRRRNLFEHALSWCIFDFSKKLNVYDAGEKVDTFGDIYKNGITVSRLNLEKYLNSYVRYTEWVDQYFGVQSYFDYDQHMSNIEQYILDLDFMKINSNNSWQDMFGQDFDTWNACHRMLPNLLLRDPAVANASQQITLNRQTVTAEDWLRLRGPDWPERWEDFHSSNLPVAVEQQIKSALNLQTVPVTEDEYIFLKQNLDTYNHTYQTFLELKHRGFLVTNIPIKLQSLKEKIALIKNIEQCRQWYNEWAEKNSHNEQYSLEQLQELATKEETNLLRPVTQQLTYSVNKSLSG